MLTKQNPLMKQTIAETFPPASVSFFDAKDSFPSPKTRKRCAEQLRAYSLWLHTGMRSRWDLLDQPHTTHCCSKHDSSPAFPARKNSHEWWRSFHCNCRLKSSTCKTQLSCSGLCRLYSALLLPLLENSSSRLYWLRVFPCHFRTSQHISATD